MRWILALFLAVTACGAQAQIAGLTLPVDGRLLLWDMGAAPPRVLTAPLPSTFSAGRCYILDGNSLHVQRSAACLDYYVYRGALDPLPRLAVTGWMSFNGRAPDADHLGLQLDGATGLGGCAPGTDCSRIAIAGFASRDVAADAMTAARNGRRVTLTGREIQRHNSRAIIVQRLNR